MLIYSLMQVGVAVFAVSGALTAGRRGFDWVGVIVVAFVTALGGGTFRDVLLNRAAVFWIADTTYVWTTLAATVATLVYVRFQKPPDRALLIADALGMALFTLSGAQIAEASGASPLVVVLMGALTGAGGGALRDIACGTEPLLFRPSEPLYSSAAASGVVVYLILDSLGVGRTASFVLGAGFIVILRIAAIKWNIRLPAFEVQR